MAKILVMFIETEEFTTNPLPFTPEQQADMAQKLMRSKTLDDGFIEDSGIVTLAPRSKKGHYLEQPVWSQALRKIPSKDGYRAQITRDGLVKVTRTHNPNAENTPARIIFPGEFRFVADEYPKRMNVPESGILADLASFRTEFVDPQNLTQQELDDLLFNVEQGQDIDPQKLMHKVLSQAIALQVPGEYDGRRVQAILFKSRHGLDYIPDGVVIDILTQQLLPKRVVYPFMNEESVNAATPEEVPFA